MARIRIEPQLPAPGRLVLLCYDGRLPATLRVSWPGSSAAPREVVVSTAGALAIIVPADAGAMLVRDPGGEAESTLTLTAAPAGRS